MKNRITYRKGYSSKEQAESALTAMYDRKELNENKDKAEVASYTHEYLETERWLISIKK